MSTDIVSTDGVGGVVPSREATTGVNVPPGGAGPRRGRGKSREPEFRSYYDLPVINKPVWESPDIPGYLFLGGLAGAGAAVGLAAQMTGRPALARASKVGAAAAGHLSLVALIHDLGRRGRFLNMLRMLKPTSPMSVGSWILAGFVPAASVAAGTAVTGLLPRIGTMASTGAALLGMPLSTYTAALISNTAVPAWHDGHEVMPFVFAASAATSAAAFGLITAPAGETDPLAGLGAGAGLAEVALSKAMEDRTGLTKETFHEGKAGKLMKAADALTTSGALAALASRWIRVRPLRALAGSMLFAGSVCTRFGIFEAGMASSEDPKYTVVPQRERLESRAGGTAG